MKNLHSPLPWKAHPLADEQILDSKGNAVSDCVPYEGGGINSEEDIKIIVKAVNSYYRMVSALQRIEHETSEDFISKIAKEGLKAARYRGNLKFITE